MSYINPAPGSASKQVVVKLDVAPAEGNITLTGSPLTVPALQNLTINAANDTFTWSQLDSSAKKSIATTSTNSLAMNAVVDQASFFGSNLTAQVSDTVAAQGVMGLSRNKTLTNFSIRFENDGTATYIKGQGYITGLAPAISADQPVWVTPLNIAVTGEFTTSATE